MMVRSAAQGLIVVTPIGEQQTSLLNKDLPCIFHTQDSQHLASRSELSHSPLKSQRSLSGAGQFHRTAVVTPLTWHGMLQKSIRTTDQRKSRRKRQPVACARCRRMKRRCDRAVPCLSCKTAQVECRLHDTPRDNATLSEDQADRNSETSFGAKPHDQELLLAVLRDPPFVDVLLRIWFSHLDFMYDSVVDTRLHRLWTQHQLESAVSSCSLRPLISIILALTCQIAPERIGSAIANCAAASFTTDGIVTISFDYAKRAIDMALEACNLHSSLDIDLVEHLQASLLMAAFLKNADKLFEYRTRLSRDIAFLQCIGIHTLGHVAQDATRCSVQEMARRLWWSYFQYDRFYWLMDPSFPYQVSRRHCDISFLDHTGLQHHISCQQANLGSNMGLPVFQLGSSHGETPRLADEPRMSRFTSNMICIALATEHVSDRLADLGRLGTRLNNDSETTLQLESAIDGVIAEFNLLFSTLEQQQSTSLDSVAGTSIHIRQGQVSSITLDTLRYQACTSLASCASHLSIAIKSKLGIVRAEATATLVQRALELTAGLSPSELRWAFFLNYIGRSTADLARLVLEPSLQMAGSSSWVGLLVRSRNFLCLIASHNEDSLPARITQEVCLNTARIFAGVDRALEADLKDVRKTAADALRAEQVWQNSAQQLQRQQQQVDAPGRSGETQRDLIMPGEHELMQQIILLEAFENLFAFTL